MNLSCFHLSSFLLPLLKLKHSQKPLFSKLIFINNLSLLLPLDLSTTSDLSLDRFSSKTARILRLGSSFRTSSTSLCCVLLEELSSSSLFLRLDKRPSSSLFLLLDALSSFLEFRPLGMDSDGGRSTPANFAKFRLFNVVGESVSFLKQA